MTFSEFELYWLDFCVHNAHLQYNGIVDFSHLLRRIKEEKTKLPRMPRTPSETAKYKNEYYRKNRERILARMRKNYISRKKTTTRKEVAAAK